MKYRIYKHEDGLEIAADREANHRSPYNLAT
jgi:hypothetical protein